MRSHAEEEEVHADWGVVAGKQKERESDSKGEGEIRERTKDHAMLLTLKWFI